VWHTFGCAPHLLPNLCPPTVKKCVELTFFNGEVGIFVDLEFEVVEVDNALKFIVELCFNFDNMLIQSLYYKLGFLKLSLNVLQLHFNNGPKNDILLWAHIPW